MLRNYGVRRGTEQEKVRWMKRERGKKRGEGQIYVLMRTGRKKNSVGGGRRGNPYMEGQAREASRGRVQALGRCDA
jgi:hypothetical protein